MLSYEKVISEGLISLGVLSQRQIQETLKAHKVQRRRFGKLLVELKFISSESIAKTLISQFGISPVKINPVTINKEAAGVVSYEFASLHRVIPIKLKKNSLTLATDSLFNFLARENLESFLRVSELDLVYVQTEILDLYLEKIYQPERTTKKIKPEEKKPARPFSEFMCCAQNLTGKEDAPIVKLVSLLLQEAYQDRASDVHLEPLEDKFRIRYRIDGVLQEVPGPPKRLTGSLISRVKIMAGMNIAEKRLPQDGRIKFNIGEKELDLRVSSIPTLHGESIVIRILDRSRLTLDLKKTGFSSQDKAKYEDLINLPSGIILVTGPTGCGKTTTLYTSLTLLNKPTKKILTLEDPVEYQLPGVNQVQIKPEIDLDFASGLRSMLRQAPDVIMIGEIRDYEAAAIAIQAALTGHLILSTLHTNDAPGAITRLIDMGIKPYLVASTLQGVLAQRLIRTLCPKCKKPYQPTSDDLDVFNKTAAEAKGLKFYQAAGCDECHSSGYSGRLGIFELLILDDEIRNYIAEEPVTYKIRQMADKKGMHNLREDGWSKAAQGLTSLAEILRVTQ